MQLGEPGEYGSSHSHANNGYGAWFLVTDDPGDLDGVDGRMVCEALNVENCESAQDWCDAHEAAS